MFKAQLAVPAFNVHRLVVSQLHRFPVVEVLFPLHSALTLDCIHLSSKVLFVFPPLSSGLFSLLLGTLSIQSFLVHLLLNFLLELLFFLLKSLLSLHGLFHRLLSLEHIVYLLF